MWRVIRWGRQGGTQVSNIKITRVLRLGGSERTQHREVRLGREDEPFGNGPWGAGASLNKVWGWGSAEKAGLENPFSRNSYRMRSDETSSKKSKDKKRKTMFFVDTYCTSQWLSNSFFPTLADVLDSRSKEILDSNTAGNPSRLHLQPSLWSPRTLVTGV